MLIRIAVLFTFVFAGTLLYAQDHPLSPEGSWPDIREFVVGDEEIVENDPRLEVTTPARAEDAATVPVRFRASDPKMVISDATIVIDENPSPIAAKFHFGANMQPLDFETRVRVNLYSNLRVVVKSDEDWLMAGGFVKASGGCSAPATKSADTQDDDIGEMRLRKFDEIPKLPSSSVRKSIQLMIRHPNYSGLQRDQITQLMIPSNFIQELSLYQGDDLLFSMEGGISISENPSFRFDFNDNGAISLRAEAKDTEGKIYVVEFEKDSIQ